jgi:hypothetical protein
MKIIKYSLRQSFLILENGFYMNSDAEMIINTTIEK